MAKHGGTSRREVKNQAVSEGRSAFRHDAKADRSGRIDKSRVRAVMAAAERSGLLREKGGRIGGRISKELVRQAKAQTGIEADTDLIEFALANVALEDKFAKAFKAVRGKVDPSLKLNL